MSTELGLGGDGVPAPPIKVVPKLALLPNTVLQQHCSRRRCRGLDQAEGGAVRGCGSREFCSGGGGGTPIFTCSSGDMVIPCLAADSPRPSPVAPASNCKSLRQDLEPLLVLPSPTSSFSCGRPSSLHRPGEPMGSPRWEIPGASLRHAARVTPSDARQAVLAWSAAVELDVRRRTALRSSPTPANAPSDAC